jgi:holo-[acyl-carrier protein] synthase
VELSGAAVQRLAAQRGPPRDLPVRAPASGTRVGCDLVEVERFEQVLARNPPAFRDQMFTAAEQHAATSTEELARRFAVKEATLKALGIGLVAGIHPTDIEVSAGADGRCHVQFRGVPEALGRGRRIHARAWIEAGCASAIVWIARGDGDSG